MRAYLLTVECAEAAPGWGMCVGERRTILVTDAADEVEAQTIAERASPRTWRVVDWQEVRAFLHIDARGVREAIRRQAT